jgi:signal transduction histidine kinase
MPAPKLPTLKEIKKDIKDSYVEIQQSFTKMQILARKKGDKGLLQLLSGERKIHLSRLKYLSKKADALREEFISEIKLNAQALSVRIKELERVQDATKANNYLLEFKRKELLVESEELKNHTESIRNKSIELLAQKEDIARQVQELQKTHSELLEKKDELEEKSNALLDQTDYLHDANQIILTMHEELKTQKDEIMSKNEELQNLNLEKNNLIGIVAHDLKSPLNQIRGLVSIIKITEANMTEESTNCLGLIENSLSRLSGMISKILDIEAIESRKLNLSIQRMNISESLRVIVERFEQEAERKGINLHFGPTPSLFVEADNGYITQIFENLLSNAIKFSPSNKNVFVSVIESDEKLNVVIKDEGPGMTEDDKKKLFNKYQKLSARPTANESSTGLGLSIVKKFVEAMNGRIWCESEEGHGSSFFVEFAKVHEPTPEPFTAR